ncbi:3307_t:CDS:2 [Paraglomus occultum]|uniref:3307_t:CDS:1 n=1 Tax=Paraglomus occultum TaxID=144539 RepID=A0A9N9AFH8_9GLOM|nr:3307_t:CDS:2 [Paraglomus occultum]
MREYWTKKEDRTLCELQRELGSAWTKISIIMATKTSKQCSERWNNAIRPGINSDPLSDEERTKIDLLYCDYGPQWSVIASKIPGRTSRTYTSLTNFMYASSQLIRAKEQEQEQGRTDHPRIPIPIEDNMGDPDIEISHQLTVNEDLIEPEKFLRLKECLENKSSGADICNELLKEMDPIIRLPPVQFQKLCKQFDMSQLSDDTLRVFCHELVKRDDIIFQNYVILFRLAYLDKIRQLVSMPSRSLISSILNIARIKGRALVEALLLPLLNDANSIGMYNRYRRVDAQ